MQMGDKERSFWVRQSLGGMAEALGKVVEARTHFEANLEYLSELGNQEGQENYRQRLAQLDKRVV